MGRLKEVTILMEPNVEQLNCPNTSPKNLKDMRGECTEVSFL